MNNYNIFVYRNNLLPSCYNYNTYHKINNMNNSAYIDTFLSSICSEITLNNLNPSFPIFYGSFNGIKKEFSNKNLIFSYLSTINTDFSKLFAKKFGDPNF